MSGVSPATWAGGHHTPWTSSVSTSFCAGGGHRASLLPSGQRIWGTQSPPPGQTVLAPLPLAPGPQPRARLWQSGGSLQPLTWQLTVQREEVGVHSKEGQRLHHTAASMGGSHSRAPARLTCPRSAQSWLWFPVRLTRWSLCFPRASRWPRPWINSLPTPVGLLLTTESPGGHVPASPLPPLPTDCPLCLLTALLPPLPELLPRAECSP